IQGLRNSKPSPSGDGIVDTDPDRPGSKRIQFSYTIDTQGKGYKFLKTLTLPTNDFGVIFPDSGFEITSKHLSLQGPMDAEGQKFYNMSGRDFPRGFRIVVEINDSPAKDGVITWGVVVLVVIILGAGIGMSLKMRKVSSEDEFESREDVLRAIAELDDRAEAGKIDLGEYKIERAALISRTREFTE
ncbi:MAG: hypothetical protein JRD68_01495, partial [Deltaproteobacteria bacterium]|nr:hypothetical protein [Deltaproteobacteria bacterium]